MTAPKIDILRKKDVDFYFLTFHYSLFTIFTVDFWKVISYNEYWLELLLEGEYTENKSVLECCVEVKKILIASINTAKNNK